MKFKLKIVHKLTFWISGLLLLTIFSLSILYYQTTKNALIERTINQIESIKMLKDGWLKAYLRNQSEKLRILSQIYVSNPKKNIVVKQEYFNKDHNFSNIFYSNHVNCIDSNGYNCLDSSKKIFFISNQKFKKTFNRIHQNQLLLFSDANNSNLWLLIKVNENLCFAKEIKMDSLNNILTQRTGMGKTGESYLVDEKKILRTDSRFYNEKNLKIIVDTKAYKDANNGISGSEIIKDYRNIDVLSSFKSFEYLNLKWVLISEIDYEESMIPVYKLRNTLILFALVVIIIAIILTLWISSLISKPITSLSELIKELSFGKLPLLPSPNNGSDEIDEMSNAVILLADGLKKTAKFAENIGNGDFSQPFQTLSEEDILGNSLLNMRKQLVFLNEKISKQNKLKTLALLEGQENERQRISRDLHDGVGQMLTALRFRLLNLENTTAYQAEIKGLIDETIKELKRVVVNLMPSVIWDVGLEAAINILIQNTKPLQISFSYTKSEDATLLPLEMRLTAYRIIQECINNILKHAQTNQVEIIINKDKSVFYMKIKDYGIGFSQDVENKIANNQHGLKNIKERVNLVNGKCKITSIIKKGTIVEIWIPIVKKDE